MKMPVVSSEDYVEEPQEQSNLKDMPDPAIFVQQCIFRTVMNGSPKAGLRSMRMTRPVCYKCLDRTRIPRC